MNSDNESELSDYPDSPAGLLPAASLKTRTAYKQTPSDYMSSNEDLKRKKNELEVLSSASTIQTPIEMKRKRKKVVEAS